MKKAFSLAFSFPTLPFLFRSFTARTQRVDRASRREGAAAAGNGLAGAEERAKEEVSLQKLLLFFSGFVARRAC